MNRLYRAAMIAAVSVLASAAPTFAQGANTLSPAEVDRLLTVTCKAQYGAVRRFIDTQPRYKWADVDAAIRELIGGPNTLAELADLRKEAINPAASEGQQIINRLQVCMIDGKMAILNARQAPRAAPKQSAKASKIIKT